MSKTNTFLNKKYDYVKSFEFDDKILPACYIVCRIDGKNFHNFSDLHNFEKPNDLNAIKLMNHSALEVMKNIKDIVFAYGQSDEFSFIFPKDSLYVLRRASKLISHVVSFFTSAYTFHWNEYFSKFPLKSLPAFDGRVIAYPNELILKDYINWRQVDCHVNNLYNTTFWAIVQRDKKSPQEAQHMLKGTLSSDKNEILFRRGTNYNEEPQIYRKGTFLIKESLLSLDFKNHHLLNSQNRGSGKNKTFDFYMLNDHDDDNNSFDGDKKSLYLALHFDFINGNFWTENPSILSTPCSEN